MKTKIELNEKELRELVLAYLSRQLGDLDFNIDDIKIQVKSKQNYKSEWESAEFKATLEVFK